MDYAQFALTGIPVGYFMADAALNLYYEFRRRNVKEWKAIGPVTYIAKKEHMANK